MSTHINGLALQRMHWIGLLAAILVWVLGGNGGRRQRNDLVLQKG